MVISAPQCSGSALGSRFGGPRPVCFGETHPPGGRTFPVRKWALKPSGQWTPSALSTTKGSSVQPHPSPEKHPQVVTPSPCPSLTLGLKILTWVSVNSWILGFRRKPVIGELIFPITSKTLCFAAWFDLYFLRSLLLNSSAKILPRIAESVTKMW